MSLNKLMKSNIMDDGILYNAMLQYNNVYIYVQLINIHRHTFVHAHTHTRTIVHTNTHTHINYITYFDILLIKKIKNDIPEENETMNITGTNCKITD